MTPVASLPTRRLRQLRLDTGPGRRSLLDTEARRRSLLDTARPPRRSPCTDGSRLTLEQSLEGVWEDLLAVGAADCVVCGFRMERTGAGGECGGCGSRVG